MLFIIFLNFIIIRVLVFFFNVFSFIIIKMSIFIDCFLWNKMVKFIFFISIVNLFKKGKERVIFVKYLVRFFGVMEINFCIIGIF